MLITQPQSNLVHPFPMSKEIPPPDKKNYTIAANPMAALPENCPFTFACYEVSAISNKLPSKLYANLSSACLLLALLVKSKQGTA